MQSLFLFLSTKKNLTSLGTGLMKVSVPSTLLTSGRRSPPRSNSWADIFRTGVAAPELTFLLLLLLTELNGPALQLDGVGGSVSPDEVGVVALTAVLLLLLVTTPPGTE